MLGKYLIILEDILAQLLFDIKLGHRYGSEVILVQFYWYPDQLVPVMVQPVLDRGSVVFEGPFKGSRKGDIPVAVLVVEAIDVNRDNAFGFIQVLDLSLEVFK